MWKLLIWCVPIVLLAGGYYIYQRYDIQGLDRLRVVRRGEEPAASTPESPFTGPAAARRATIRLATFNLERFDEAKLANPRAREIVTQLIGRFDLAALQGIHARNQGLLVRLLEQVNAAGRDYDFAVAAEPAAPGAEAFNAFVFDRTSIEVDRSTVAAVNDASGHLYRRALAGSFRARAAAPAEAFTFTLVNVQIDPERAAEELDLLDDVFRAVRDSRPHEDDIILLGSLQAGPDRLARLNERFELVFPIAAVPTTTRGTQLADNILFPRRATVEFTGRCGVVDLMREFGLSMQEALEVSEHLPVWVEFSVYEGGQPGQVDNEAERTAR